MPSLSPTMTEGQIVKWTKNEGDPVNAGTVGPNFLKKIIFCQIEGMIIKIFMTSKLRK